MKTIFFDNKDLISKDWTGKLVKNIWCFNPALVRLSSGWGMFYRLVIDGRGGLERKIAACKLNENFVVDEGSVSLISDQISLPKYSQTDSATLKFFRKKIIPWFADPRVFVICGKYFLYFNTVPQRKIGNQHFIVEIDVTNLTIIDQPLQLIKRENHQYIEKNWMFFDSDGLIHSIYSPENHRIYQCIVGGNNVLLDRLVSLDKQYNGLSHLRGGAPPVKYGNQYYNFCHTVTTDRSNSIRYDTKVYVFDSTLPFEVKAVPRKPLNLENPYRGLRDLPKLNFVASDVEYVSGAIHHLNHWYLSYGINDEKCAIAIYEDCEIDEFLLWL